MHKRLKELTNKLSNILIKETLKFLAHNMKDEENISDLIDLVISSNLSCAFELMDRISKGNKEIEKNVHEFTFKVTNYIMSLKMINHAEWIKNDE